MTEPAPFLSDKSVSFNKYLYQPPQGPIDWSRIWEDIFASESTEGAMIEHRKTDDGSFCLTIKIQRYHKYCFFVRIFEQKDITDALRIFWESATASLLARGGILTQCMGSLHLKGENGKSFRYTSLPVYQKGWDIYIEPNKRFTKTSFDTLFLPDQVRDALTTVSQMIYFHITLVYALKLTRTGVTANASTEFKV